MERLKKSELKGLTAVQLRMAQILNKVNGYESAAQFVRGIKKQNKEGHMNTALIVVDVQKDFCEKGALAVPGADDIVPTINKYIKLLYNRALIIFSRDWHPKETEHFKKWPEHCIQDMFGALFHEDLLIPSGAITVSKGMGDKDDGYSAFEGKYRVEITSGVSLGPILNNREIKNILVCGLATDYCVKATVLESLDRGYNTYLLHDAIRAVNKNQEDGITAIDIMEKAGVKLMDFATLETAGGMINGV
jgi:nicotinamidase/pyrazinamidase